MRTGSGDERSKRTSGRGVRPVAGWATTASPLAIGAGAVLLGGIVGVLQVPLLSIGRAVTGGNVELGPLSLLEFTLAGLLGWAGLLLLVGAAALFVGIRDRTYRAVALVTAGVALCHLGVLALGFGIDTLWEVLGLSEGPNAFGRDFLFKDPILPILTLENLVADAVRSTAVALGASLVGTMIAPTGSEWWRAGRRQRRLLPVVLGAGIAVSLPVVIGVADVVGAQLGPELYRALASEPVESLPRAGNVAPGNWLDTWYSGEILVGVLAGVTLVGRDRLVAALAAGATHAALAVAVWFGVPGWPGRIPESRRPSLLFETVFAGVIIAVGAAVVAYVVGKAVTTNWTATESRASESVQAGASRAGDGGTKRRHRPPRVSGMGRYVAIATAVVAMLWIAEGLSGVARGAIDLNLIGFWRELEVTLFGGWRFLVPVAGLLVGVVVASECWRRSRRTVATAAAASAVGYLLVAAASLGIRVGRVAFNDNGRDLTEALFEFPVWDVPDGLLGGTLLAALVAAITVYALCEPVRRR